jgi:hypothetical protein
VTWLRTTIAGKDEAGRLFHADKAPRCSCRAASGPLHHPEFLQRLQTRLHPRHDHGPAPAVRRSVTCIRVDRRPRAHDHRKDEAEAPGARMDVVLLEPQDAAAAPSSRCAQSLSHSAVQERASYVDSTSKRDSTRHVSAKKMQSSIHISWLQVLKLPTSDSWK